jgi:hypothetical protein
MHRLTFFPLGNADTCRIDLENGKKILIDYAATRSSDPEDRRIDLPTELKKDLASADRDNFDVVAFTHLDNDHVVGAGEFFYLEHADKYKGAGRIKIDVLWVPAAAILEAGLEDDARIIREEAKHRLRKGSGIRVFSKPNLLKDWLNKEGLTLESRADLITDAGCSAPDFSISSDGTEFFIHSPFASTLNQSGAVVRNDDCLTFHVTFDVRGVRSYAFFAADAPHEVLSQIVEITKDHENTDRLDWDVMSLSHHSSYLSVGPEKGRDQTVPVAGVKTLLEDHARDKAIYVSTSDRIPDVDTTQPPHRQAAEYYKDCASDRSGRYVVTMVHPNVANPKPLVIKIDSLGPTVASTTSSHFGASTDGNPSPVPPPKAGQY